MMAVHSTYLLLLAILVPATTGYGIDTYFEGSETTCRPKETQELRDKFCHHLVNATIITDQHDFTKAASVCADIALLFYNILKEHSKNFQILFCDELEDCLTAMMSVMSACVDVIWNVLPPELKNPDGLLKISEGLVRMRRMRFGVYIALGILFIIGIVGNGLLLIMFRRHKHIRNDVMLINLTVADLLSLTINLPIFITVISSQTLINFFAVFSFGSRLCIFVSEYSLVIISFQRFRAVSKMSVIRNEKTFPDWIIVTAVWLLGSVYGLIYFLSTEALFNQWTSFTNIFKIFVILLFITIVTEGVLPPVLVTVFSVLASRGLEKHANNFPGDRSHNLEHIKNRYLASKALIAFVILFLISYVPYHITLLTLFNYYTDLENVFRNILDFETWANLIGFSYAIMFLNSAFNPVVLYFVSSKFRRYFKSYLCCRSRELDSIPSIV